MFTHPDNLASLVAQHQAELLDEAEQFRRIKQARAHRRRTSLRSHFGGRPREHACGTLDYAFPAAERPRPIAQ